MKVISDFLKSKWYLLIAFVVVAFFGIRYALKVPSFRLKVDRLLVKGPGFGPLITKV